MKCALIIVLFGLLNSEISFAQSSFDKVGIPAMKKSVIESFVKTDQGKACPAAGSVSFDRLAELTGSASSSVDSVARLLEAIKPRQGQLNVDSRGESSNQSLVRLHPCAVNQLLNLDFRLRFVLLDLVRNFSCFLNRTNCIG